MEVWSRTELQAPGASGPRPGQVTVVVPSPVRMLCVHPKAAAGLSVCRIEIGALDDHTVLSFIELASASPKTKL